jgi:23S rRNA pseudouridine2605 synthase
VTKTYLALVEGIPSESSLRRLRDGVDLEDGPAAAKSARIIDRHDDRSLVELVMTEGRKREVRRMFDEIGHPVARLVRTAIGPIADRAIKPGEWRDLSIEEVRGLYAAGHG